MLTWSNASGKRPGRTRRTLEDLFAYADAEGVKLRLDGTEVQVRRPRVGHPGRKAFDSGKTWMPW
jgi:hypothetical protein